MEPINSNSECPLKYNKMIKLMIMMLRRVKMTTSIWTVPMILRALRAKRVNKPHLIATSRIKRKLKGLNEERNYYSRKRLKKRRKNCSSLKRSRNEGRNLWILKMLQHLITPCLMIRYK